MDVHTIHRPGASLRGKVRARSRKQGCEKFLTVHPFWGGLVEFLDEKGKLLNVLPNRLPGASVSECASSGAAFKHVASGGGQP